MTTLTVQNVNSVVFGSMAVTYKPISGGTGTEQIYEMWGNSQPMHQAQGHASTTAYNIMRDTANGKWHDSGSDMPAGFEISNSTTHTSATTTTGWTSAATSTNKYLHIYQLNGTYIGYMDVWTPFQSSGSGSSYTRPTASTITINGGTWSNVEYRHDSSQDTATASFYELWNPPNQSATDHGIELRQTITSGNLTTTLYPNTDNNTADPYEASIGNGTKSTSLVLTSGDVGSQIKFFSSGGTTSIMEFQLTASMLWTGSGSGSGSGSGRQTFSSGESGIINVEFNKLTDSSIELGFDWQGISVYQVYVDRGGTVTWTQLSLTGSSGTVTGYTGAGAHALTGLNEGDKVWVNNATDADGNLPVFTNKFIEWSYDPTTTPPSVKAEAFFTNNGGNGFGFNADVGLFESGAIKDTQIYSGNLENMFTEAIKGNYYTVLKPDQSQYGQGYWYFKPTKSGGSHNFW